MLPEWRDVEGKEREHMGGEWVKRPKGSERLRNLAIHLGHLACDSCAI